MSEIDYGPLRHLTGSWQGDLGQDESPEPDGIEKNAYTETIRFTPAGDVDNAETQELVAVHYHLDVHRIGDGKMIHNQTGYWIWDAESGLIMHDFVIPRAVGVVAGGSYRGETDTDGNFVFDVAAGAGHDEWQIAQSPFMQQNALTTAFRQQLVSGPDMLAYRQTTLVDIYAREGFEHTDENRLQRLE